jgi:hypothetical protein
MSDPIWGNDRDPRPPSLPPGVEAQEGLGSTLKFALTIALVLAVIVGAAYLFVVSFPDIGQPGAPAAATPSVAVPTPTGTPLPSPSPTAQPTTSLVAPPTLAARRRASTIGPARPGRL